MITQNKVILEEGAYTGATYAFVRIRDIDELSIHLKHPNAGTISVHVSNDSADSNNDLTNQTTMNAKSWAPLDLIDPSTGNQVQSVDLSTLSSSSTMVKLGCLCYELLRLTVDGGGGIYKATCSTASRAD